ncbi:MAG: serine acetyltransferase [Desulfobulbaceae bacterium A2]|nr:MAG: serine acetyltransferase [Desulfobulbaceae bacterium A2]
MGKHELMTGECKLDLPPERRLGSLLQEVVSKLSHGFRQGGWSSHLDPVPLPSRTEVVGLIDLVRRILFPGYFSPLPLGVDGLEYQLGQELAELSVRLGAQIQAAIRHECLRHDQSCSNCAERGAAAGAQFIAELPCLKELLESDIAAALAGDPAARNDDEVIFSYPGLFAVYVHRIAHLLYRLEVPVIPRIMSEHAFSRTAIDIHPGASIGGSFFIDHGAGVVIGETSHIGERVRLYQGVTLGALSLSRDEVKRLRQVKRHPTIEDDVIIYANAIILGGDTVIGARSVIGGNVWLTSSVPADTRVLLVPPELIYRGKKEDGA